MLSVDVVCQSCGSQDLRPFHRVESVPVQVCRLVPSRDEALRAPRGELHLALCRSCDFIQNVAFDPSLVDYADSYEDSQAFSPRFRAFAEEVAGDLIDSYGIRGRQIVEIGCGKGDFLLLICEMGGNRGVGIDPSYEPGRLEGEALSRIEFIRDEFSPRYSHLRGDLFCCRHTLEHIPAVSAFLEAVCGALEEQPDAVVFFEVPDVERVLAEGAFWDLYYEHCSYFSPGSLARLFRSHGLEVLRLRKGFSDQYLLIEARKGDPARGSGPQAESAGAQLADSVRRFARVFQETLAGWTARLAELRASGERAVLWGAGSKAVGFLTTLPVAEEVEYVVDINPHKQGQFLAGTGQQIVGPEFLREYEPGEVIVMNPIYLDEIRVEISEMGLSPRITAV